MANFKHCGVSLLQSLFLRSTALVLLGHRFQMSSSIAENDFESIFKWSALAPNALQPTNCNSHQRIWHRQFHKVLEGYLEVGLLTEHHTTFKTSNYA